MNIDFKILTFQSGTCINQRPIVKNGEKVEKGDVMC